LALDRVGVNTALARPLRGNREWGLRPPTQTNPLQQRKGNPKRAHVRHSQDGGGVRGRRPHSRWPQKETRQPVVDDAIPANKSVGPRAWSGERAWRHRPARGVCP